MLGFQRLLRFRGFARVVVRAPRTEAGGAEAEPQHRPDFVQQSVFHGSVFCRLFFLVAEYYLVIGFDDVFGCGGLPGADFVHEDSLVAGSLQAAEEIGPVDDAFARQPVTFVLAVVVRRVDRADAVADGLEKVRMLLFEQVVRIEADHDFGVVGDYKKLGYVPAYSDPKKWENWSLSKTLEYAYDDYCIAKMAEKMGKKEIADEFFKRSQNYHNVYNPATSFMQPRDEKGNFAANFSPDDYTEDICESNGWQYFWSVPQDLDGLIGLVGSKERFAEKLDSMFTYVPKSDEELPIFSTGMIGQYAHGNEPSHHVIYLYNKVGQPWKTQKYVAQVLHDLYLNTPDGICGNEDCGQMSAWFVFSAMGFYPVDPISGKYEIGTPIFPEVKMHLANGKTFVVLAPAVSRENIYVQSVKLNGRSYDKSYITHEQIMNGDTLEFEMGNRPGPVWYNNM